MVLDCFKTVKDIFENSCSCCIGLGQTLKSWIPTCSSLGEIIKVVVYFLGAGACCVLAILGWRKFKSIIPKPAPTNISEKLQDSLLELGLTDNRTETKMDGLDSQVKQIGRKLNIL